MLPEVVWVSRRGFSSLEERRRTLDAELEELRGHLITSYHSDPDMRENPDFMELRMRIMHVLPRQLAELTRVMDNARIIEDSDGYRHSDFLTVELGARVLVDFGNGDMEDYTVLGYGEGELEDGAISYLSPLGMAIYGKRAGDEAVMTTPDGRQIHLRIVRIERGL